MTREAWRGGAVPRYELEAWRARFGVVAGVTARATAEGDTFCLGLWTGEPVGEVMRRWRALRGLEDGAFGLTVLGHQVHGPAVRWAEPGEGWRLVEGVDGHATAAPGVLLTVTIADCIPVYLVDARSGALALLHAGWRGTAAGILSRGLALLGERAGTRAADVHVHLGVGISGPCYEVGREVMDGCGVPAPGPGPWQLDLRAVLADQARAAGVAEVSTSDWCSARDRDRFFSHRASGGTDGRMVAYLGRPGTGAAFG
ncbi:MAG: polyphenol oxidase family protein [Gemmatimonadales bacterium]|nr:polyphenol oxidase family protein [Gemmatimonadales bacterium]